MNDVKNYMPEFVQEIAEFKMLAEAENPEIEMLAEVLFTVWQDQFIHTLTEQGLKRWEAMLKIVPSFKAGLDERRQMVFIKFCLFLPYTYRTLTQNLDALCGKDGYSIQLDYENYRLTVRIPLFHKRLFQAAYPLST